jgi:hypothetical protein
LFYIIDSDAKIRQEEEGKEEGFRQTEGSTL